jgi:hypothetical protein
VTNETKKSGTDIKVKIAILLVALLLAGVASASFIDQRNYVETVVVSEDFTELRYLSEYEPSLKGTKMDVPIFIFDSGVPGGSVLYVGGTHPYEPATSLSAYILLENIQVEKGRVFVVPQSNLSATTTGILGNAYPPYYEIETPWGVKKYKIGDRLTSPLDQWPDSFTYANYPSGQNASNQDIRNINRTYPGKQDGLITERASFAMMELIRREKIDMSIDAHEASLMYPVVSTYVAHERAMDIAMMAAMNLSATQFDMKIEQSPKSLKGFTHREWGDYSDTLAVLMETPEPFIDRIVGPITIDLMMTGQDLFLSMAAEKGLTFVPYELESGYPMHQRVGRHLSGALEAIFWMGQFMPEKEVQVVWPTYQELMEKECGYFLHNPNEADPQYVFGV